eukprot:5708795-Pyramimonas_sp.AAC.1
MERATAGHRCNRNLAMASLGAGRLRRRERLRKGIGAHGSLRQQRNTCVAPTFAAQQSLAK